MSICPHGSVGLREGAGGEDFHRELADFDPALISSARAARAFEVFTALSQDLDAASTLVASRAADYGDWKLEGHRSPGSWVAEMTGSGYGEAMGMLESSERLVELSETTEAWKRGELSGRQVREIAATVTADPRAEGELLEAARRSGLKGLRDDAGG